MVLLPDAFHPLLKTTCVRSIALCGISSFRFPPNSGHQQKIYIKVKRKGILEPKESEHVERRVLIARTILIPRYVIRKTSKK